MPEVYGPSMEDIANASKRMTGQEKEQSAQREAQFSSPENKSFSSKNNTLLLDINKSSLKLDHLTEVAKENSLEEKDEFHITILGFKDGNIIKKVLKGLSPEEQQIKNNQIQELVNQTDWQFSPEGKDLHITKEYKDNDGATTETRESYIQMIHMPALGQFYAQLNSLLGTNLTPPPTHVTLFTGGSDKEKSKMGIGINSEAELTELNPQTIEQESLGNQTEQINNEWSLEVLEQVKDIKASQTDPERTWLTTHFRITRPDGTTKEIKATDTILKMRSKSGEEIEVPAFAIEHIESLHKDGNEAGSTITSESIESAFRSMAEHLPERIPFDDETAAFEIDTDKETGTEGVSSKQEMLAKGTINLADLSMLKSVKSDVFRLNLEGSDIEKKELVDNFNAQMTGNLKLGIRGNAITPFFTAERQETTKMFLVIGKDEDNDGSKHNRVITMSPGRYMDKLPNDSRFIGQNSTQGIPEGTTVAQLIQKSQAGETLSSVEEKLVKDQEQAQECWWNSGFIETTQTK